MLTHAIPNMEFPGRSSLPPSTRPAAIQLAGENVPSLVGRSFTSDAQVALVSRVRTAEDTPAGSPLAWFVAIAALAIALAGGCAKTPDDASLVTKIKSEMASDPALKAASPQVTSEKNSVTLSGTVTSSAARLDALKIAAQTPGVTKVNDELIVEAPPPAVLQGAGDAPVRASPPRSTERRAKKGPDKGDVVPRFPVYAGPPLPSSAPVPPQIPVADLPSAAALPIPVPPAAPPSSLEPKDVLIPANITVTIRMIDAVDSRVNHAGEIFHASLEAPIVVDREEVAPRGADVYVRLASAKQAGPLRGKGELNLELVKLEFQGRSYPLVSGTYYLSGTSRGKETAKKVGAGAVLGSVIGAIAGHGAGAAIGAAVGAGASGVYQGMTKGKKVQVPSETKLEFLLEQPVTVTVMPHRAPGAE